MRNQVSSDILKNAVVEAIREKKGFDIAVLDMRKLKNQMTDFFVICTGNSSTQVQAISDSIEEELKKNLKERPLHIEGYNNAEWILLDYVDVIVHVFQPQAREFYNIEALWGDAKIERFKN